MFVSADDFTSHQELEHLLDNFFYCSECGMGHDSPAKLICVSLMTSLVLLSLLLLLLIFPFLFSDPAMCFYLEQHYSASHSYRMYHCLYCTKASETREEISFHMCLDHPDQEMTVAARICISGNTAVC